ncbi:glutamate--cysteine ligase regulatory subunit [Myzus persicae]|uniref:glutamate--cysteine ligase regulatory subunit n=1 Tax=Myzus persicae TaxID=13164 RepID=UPI000B932AB5|nr:glutamate--cysteine ligase regulatory subunit [Myzus persicae]XP_022168739.1 glutamate--cysteine ligase regulatory subunit [Myzus persicae]
MPYDIPKTVSKIYIHTGNVLNANELTQKAGQNATEEVVECLSICLSKYPSPFALNEKNVHLKCDECYNNDNEEDLALKTSVKVFLTTNEVDVLEDSLKNLFKELNEEVVDSVILAFNHGKDTLLADLLTLWSILEGYVNKQKITRIGVSDIDTDLFISLYNNSIIKPTIVQINLNSCCVVPEALQEFTKDNEIQLLTHSDSKEILPQSCLAEVFGNQTELKQKIPKLEWMIRYLTHVKCRGVLASKGYIVCLKRS